MTLEQVEYVIELLETAVNIGHTMLTLMVFLFVWYVIKLVYYLFANIFFGGI
jgi:uncharacterized membrane protein